MFLCRTGCENKSPFGTMKSKSKSKRIKISGICQQHHQQSLTSATQKSWRSWCSTVENTCTAISILCCKWETSFFYCNQFYYCFVNYIWLTFWRLSSKCAAPWWVINTPETFLRRATHLNLSHCESVIWTGLNILESVEQVLTRQGFLWFNT